MATNYEYDDEDDFTEEGGDVVKQLRKVNRTLEKRLKELEVEANNLKSQTRQRTVKDVLTAKGVNPKIAAFIPQDIEGEEAISGWLNEYGDVFGVATQPEEAKQDSADISAAKRINSTINSATAPTIDEDALAKILSAEGPAALNAILGIN
jgi:hypothetical protein